MMKLLEKHFEIALETPKGINKLRDLILKLGIQGKLSTSNTKDVPASILLKKIDKERTLLLKDKKNNKQNELLPISDNDKRFELPKGWEWVRLQKIIQISSGNGLTSSQMDSNGNIPVFGGNGINGYHNVGNVTKPTLVIGRVGFYCGSVHITPNSAWVTDNAFITTFSEENIDIDFLYYLLKGTNLKENENATAQPVISGRKIYPIVVPLPPLEEQKRIVKKIEQLMQLCDKLETEFDQRNKLQVQINSSAINNLVNADDDVSFKKAWSFILDNFNTLYSAGQNISELKDTILNLAIRGKIINDLENIVVGVRFGKKFTFNEDNHPFPLPEGWKWIALKDLGVTQTGTTPPTKNPEYYGNYMPFIGPGDIKNHKIDYTNISLSELGVEKARVIRKDSIMMVCIGGSIGKMATNDRNVACNQQINTITPHSNIDLKYLYAVLRSSYFQNQVLSKASGSATPIINKQKWISILVPVPPYEIQKRISSKINYLFALCDKLEDMNNQSSKKQEQILNAVLAKI